MSSTPEGAVRDFLTAWKRRDWTAMEAALQVRQRVTHGVDAKRLEQTFGAKSLRKFAIGITSQHTEPTFIRQGRKKLWTTPESVRVGVAVVYQLAGRTFRRRVDVIVTREGPDGYPRSPGAKAEWGVNDVSATRETPL